MFDEENGVARGPPEEECYKYIIEYMQNNMINIGWAFFVLGLFYMFAWIMHIAFYFKETKEDQLSRAKRYKQNFK